jgi:hypothetical protein
MFFIGTLVCSPTVVHPDGNASRPHPLRGKETVQNPALNQTFAIVAILRLIKRKLG